MNIKEKQMVVFDLDGTLNASKVPLDEEMDQLLAKLLAKKKVAIVSGCGFDYFKLNVLEVFHCPEDLLKNLFLFPTTGARFYRFIDGEWKEIYADLISPEGRQKIKEAFEKAYKDIDYQHPPQIFGEIVEDRGTQVTFSALGQQAPVELKKQWHNTQDRRPELIKALEKYLPDFEIKMPGVTSIDVTNKGMDKAYCINKIVEIIGVPVEKMVFVGDALYEGGNDYAVKKTGVETVAVADYSETKKLIKEWLEEIDA